MSAQIIVYHEDNKSTTPKDKRNTLNAISSIKQIRLFSKAQGDDGLYVSIYLKDPMPNFPCDANQERIKQYANKLLENLPKYNLKGQLLWVSGDPEP